MYKRFCGVAAGLLSCGLLAACHLPHPDAIAPAPTLDSAKIRNALPICTGTLDSLNRTLDAGASKVKTKLHENRVVQAVMQGINRRRAVALRAIVQEASDDQVAQALQSHGLTALAASGNPKSAVLARLDGVIQEDAVGRLTTEDFRQLYDLLVRSRMIETGVRIVQYESAYLKGEFVDRFGTKWDAPKPSWQVSDDQISETLTVMLEALADEVFPHTPVWYQLPKTKPAAAAAPAPADKPKGVGRLFYPGGKANTPTFIAVIDDPAMADSLQWKMDPLVEGKPICGMTELKMDALLFLSNRAGTLAAGQSGLLLGSFGGTSVGLPIVMGKLSIGDNQTLQAMFKAVVAYIAKRGAYEASWHLLLHVDQSKLGKLGDILGDIVFKPGDEAGKPDKPKS